LALLAGVGAVLSFTAMLRADDPKSEGEWLRREMLNGKAEIKFSEIALDRASNAKVKAFAEKMVKEHKKCGEKLDTVARAMSLAPITEFNRDQAGTIDGLQKLSGVAFDRAYITRMVQDHEKAVKSFENEARNGTNADLKKICNDALPNLQEHLKEARAIADELNK
jgi:putative membrane protein